MKVVSWNINGLNNILSKSKEGTKHKHYLSDNALRHLIEAFMPDVVCLQEVRNADALGLLQKQFGDIYKYIYVNIAQKPGYSGTATLCREEPTEVEYNMPHMNGDLGISTEGRVITTTHQGKICIINTYSPNSKTKLERLDYRIDVWETALRQHISNHSRHKDIILCGDLNVAHTEYDIHNPSGNMNHAGFTQRERISFGLLLHNNNLIDAFRFLNPLAIKYSWWSNFHNSRAQNKGWRIDYFVVSKHLQNKLTFCDILTEYFGSDHAPVIMHMH